MLGHHLHHVKTLGCVVGEVFQLIRLLPMSDVGVLGPLQYMVQHLILILLLGDQLLQQLRVGDGMSDLSLSHVQGVVGLTFLVGFQVE